MDYTQFAPYIALFAALFILSFFLWVSRCRCSAKTTFNPTKIIARCKKAIRRGADQELFDGIEILVETAAKSIRGLDLEKARVSIRSLLELSQSFAKVIPQTSKSGDISMLDRVNYLSAFLLRRLEWLYQVALLEHVDPVAEEILTTFAKMSFSLAKVHSTLAFMPLVFMERSVTIALKNDADELASRAEVILSELIKSFIALSKEKNESLKELIQRTLMHLERSVKASFEKNRDMGVALMMQPFAEIASFIVEGEFKDFPERDEVIADIKRVLQQFSSLESIMQNVNTGSDASSA